MVSAVKILFIFDKSLMRRLTFGERGILYWSTVCQKNGKYNDHLGVLLYENKCSVPPIKIQNASVKN